MALELVQTRKVNRIKNILSKIWGRLWVFFKRDPISGVKIQRIPGNLSRFGRDAGWVIPEGLLNENSICYLVGAGEDISFDLQIADRFGCSVFIFDPTPKAISHFQRIRKDVNEKDSAYGIKVSKTVLEKISFVEEGIWSKKDVLKFYAPQNSSHVSHSVVNLQKTSTYFEAPVDSLSSMMQRFNHKKIDLLKLDVEGAEYSIIDSLLTENIPIGLLCVEFDECFQPLDKKYNERIKSYILKLVSSGFILINIEFPGNYTFIRSVTPWILGRWKLK